MMRILFWLLIAALVWWLSRNGRRAGPTPPAAPDRPPTAQPMLACAWCGLHLPRDEALPGQGGVFCGAAHRAAYEQAHPPL